MVYGTWYLRFKQLTCCKRLTQTNNIGVSADVNIDLLDVLLLKFLSLLFLGCVDNGHGCSGMISLSVVIQRLQTVCQRNCLKLMLLPSI